ncbi:hypothetical protein LQV63_27365 [Paenibacillus profundus]|uniref:DinB-like domain-containing protein n=1 Tax=Paenibacillus profundus TaxID=1173085 RepID=A0ABS8YRI9_9BACL|nr:MULTISPECIES: hypothetical protein [Paenibacillus]MCE5172986.1 hypothetical protein [Paenibacillus profundus]
MEWQTPIDGGKWTIHDIVSHIMLWDKYFYEEAIYPIANDKQMTVSHLDFDAFNKEAIEYGKTITKDELIQLTTHYRNLLLESGLMRELNVDRVAADIESWCCKRTVTSFFVPKLQYFL